MEKAKDKSQEYVDGYTLAGTTLVFLPVPGSAAVGLTIAEAVMVGTIAKIYGLKLDSVVWPLLLKTALLSMGGTAILKGAAELVGAIPIIGWIGKPLIAASTIQLIGNGAIKFFERRFPNQDAHSKPSWDAFLIVFGAAGIDLEIDDLKRYWDSL